MSVHLFLNQAFDELLSKNFSIPPEEWQKFCDRQGITNDQLQEEKLRLEGELKAMVNPSNDEQEQKLKDIFCCDPFAPKSVEDLLAFWQINNRTLFEYLLSYHDIQLRSYINRIRSSASSNSNQTSQNNSQPNPNNQTSSSTPPSNSAPQKNNDLVKLIGKFLGIFSTPAQKLIEFSTDFWVQYGSLFPRSLRGFLKLSLVFILAVVLVFFASTCHIMYSAENYAKDATKDLHSHEIKALEQYLYAGFTLREPTKRFKFLPILNSNPPLSLYSTLEYLQTNMPNIHQQDEIDLSSTLSSVKAMDINRDGTTLVMSQGGSENNIHVWQWPTSTKLNEELGKITIQPKYELDNCRDNNVVSLALNSTGKSLVTGGSKGTVCLFSDIEKNSKQKSPIYKTTKVGIKSVSFSQDNKFIAIAQTDGQVVVVDVHGKILTQLQPTKEGQNSNEEKLILDVSFNQDSTRLVTAGKNGDIKLWQLKYSDKSPKLEVSSSSVIPVKSLDVQYLNCWNAYQSINSCKQTNTRKEGNDQSPFLKTVFRKGELWVLTENNDDLSVLKYSEDNKNQPIDKITLKGYGKNETGNVLTGAVFIDNSNLFTISEALLQRWNLEKKSEYPLTISNKDNEQKENFIKLSLRNKSEGHNSALSLLTINDSKQLQAWTGGGAIVPIDKKLTRQIKDVSFISKEEFVTVGEDDQILRWNTNPSKLGQILMKNKMENITSIATTSFFKPRIAVGDKTGSIDVIDLSGSSLLSDRATVSLSTKGKVKLINLSKDGRYIIGVCGEDIAYLDISNPATPSQPQRLNENSTTISGGINDIRFNDNDHNNYVAVVAKNENQIKFFKLSGKNNYDKPLSDKFKLDDDDGGNGVSFSQFNQLFPYLSLKRPLFTVVSTTGKVKIWDWQTKEIIAQFKSQLKTINSIEISSDGTELFLGGGDDKGGKVEKWPILNLDQLITKGCKWLEDYHRHSSPNEHFSVKAKCAEQLNPKK